MKNKERNIWPKSCCEAGEKKRGKENIHQDNQTRKERSSFGKNQKHILTSLGQKSPADMLEYMISSMAGGGHANPHLKMLEISMQWRRGGWRDGSAARNTEDLAGDQRLDSQHAHSAFRLCNSCSGDVIPSSDLHRDQKHMRWPDIHAKQNIHTIKVNKYAKFEKNSLQDRRQFLRKHLLFLNVLTKTG